MTNGPIDHYYYGDPLHSLLKAISYGVTLFSKVIFSISYDTAFLASMVILSLTFLGDFLAIRKKNIRYAFQFLLGVAFMGNFVLMLACFVLLINSRGDINPNDLMVLFSKIVGILILAIPVTDLAMMAFKKKY